MNIVQGICQNFGTLSFPIKVILIRTFDYELETLQHLVLALKNIRWKKEFKNIREEKGDE